MQMECNTFLSPRQAMSNPFETFAGMPLTSTSPCSTSSLPCKMEDPLASSDMASSGLPGEIWLPELVPEPSGSSVDEEASCLDSLAPSLPTSSPSRSSGGISEQTSLTRDTSTPTSCANCTATETPRWRPCPGSKGGSLCNACGLHLCAHSHHRDASRASVPAKRATGDSFKVNLTIGVQLSHAAELIGIIEQWSAANGVNASTQLSK